MPGPPPPPPPGGPPPPPVFSMPPPTISGSDDRGALLNSIRKGTKLKKAVTVDKSGPLIPGKTSSVANSNSTSSNSSSDRPQIGGPPMLNGLGALFPDGIPKLKPVNKTSNAPTPHHTPSNNNNFLNTQKQIKMQIKASDNKNRGPPPPAPTRTIPSAFTDSTPKRVPVPVRNGAPNSLQLNTSVPNIPACNVEPNHSSLHKKTMSNSNLGAMDNTDSMRNNNTGQSKPVNYGKPHIAPKPPPLNGKPSLKRMSLNRTQSMHSPRSPSPQSPGINDKMKFGTVRNLKPGFIDSLENMHQPVRPSLSERPKAPPPSIPNTPPPPSKTFIKHPGHAPPPPPPIAMLEPPSQAPPPPPHRTPPQIPRTVPPPPMLNGSVAPTPPPRFSSMKDVGDFEARFADKFHDISEFPAPMPFRGTEKFYSGLQVGSNKQQAPLPPNHIQLNNRLWDSSTC